jgi:hypothetical protein
MKTLHVSFAARTRSIMGGTASVPSHLSGVSYGPFDSTDGTEPVPPL